MMINQNRKSSDNINRQSNERWTQTVSIDKIRTRSVRRFLQSLSLCQYVQSKYVRRGSCDLCYWCKSPSPNRLIDSLGLTQKHRSVIFLPKDESCEICHLLMTNSILYYWKIILGRYKDGSVRYVEVYIFIIFHLMRGNNKTSISENVFYQKQCF